jgi:hypothetical protein
MAKKEIQVEREESWILDMNTLFLLFKKTPSLKSVLCGTRWTSKIQVVPGSYKRYMPWLELETCYADLKLFIITLRPLGTGHEYLSKLKREMKAHKNFQLWKIQIRKVGQDEFFFFLMKYESYIKELL